MVETRWESSKVYLDEILYIQRHLRKIEILTEVERYSFYEAIDNITIKLTENFHRVLSGTYVNLEKIKRVKRGVAVFESGFILPIPEDSFGKLKAAHRLYNRDK